MPPLAPHSSHSFHPQQLRKSCSSLVAVATPLSLLKTQPSFKFSASSTAEALTGWLTLGSLIGSVCVFCNEDIIRFLPIAHSHRAIVGSMRVAALVTAFLFVVGNQADCMGQGMAYQYDRNVGFCLAVELKVRSQPLGRFGISKRIFLLSPQPMHVPATRAVILIAEIADQLSR